MLIVYTFAFGIVFKAKWGVANEGHFDYATILFASLIVFNIFSETIRDSPTAITNNAGYVKKVVFPLEILPIVTLIAALVNSATSFIVMLLIMLLIGVPVHITILFFPIVIFPLVLTTLGLSFILSSIGVFLRDISHLVNHIVTVLMFTSPIFFPLDRIPMNYKKFVFLNPIGLIVEESRKVLIMGYDPDWQIVGFSTLFGVFLLFFGFYIFQKLRKGFADVL
jgi:lipopolysaccharide transport system permease protein